MSRSRRSVQLAVLVLLLLGSTFPVAAENPAVESRATPYLVWSGPGPELSFEDLAVRLAPILWFSGDEPLLNGRKRQIPQRIDCSFLLDPEEAPDSSATVYYQIHRALLRREPTSHIRARFAAERIPLADTRKLTLRFFFYYEEDFGFSRHKHDLEGVAFQVAIEPAPSGGFQARLLSAKAHAHNTDWHYNILQINEDEEVKLPLTVLVEEGKHASCPDRNADGFYTPGYDVNVRVNDAWGVRDIFRSRLTGARFRSEEFKPRTRKDSGFRVRARLASPTGDVPGLEATYELVSAHRTDPCAELEREHYLNLGKRMTELAFGSADPVLHRSAVPYRYGPKVALFPLRPMAPSYGNDGQSLVTLNVYSPWELPALGGWPFGRVSWSPGNTDRWFFDLGYTPSVSRVLDWYTAGGLRLDQVGSGGWKRSFEGELGLQVRVTQWSLPFSFRLGVRARVDDFSLSNERLVVEVGVGPFPGGSARGWE